MYRPLKDLNGIPGAKNTVICLTGYQRQDRDDIMVHISPSATFQLWVGILLGVTRDGGLMKGHCILTWFFFFFSGYGQLDGC